MMRQRSVRTYDLKVRLLGAGSILLAALCLAILPAHRGDPTAQPSAVEICVALLAVCSGCGGAAFLFEGRRLFDPVDDPRTRRNGRPIDPQETE